MSQQKLTTSLTGSCKWSSSEDLSLFRDELVIHYGDRRKVNEVFESLWYSHRHLSFSDFADAFHKVWLKGECE